MTWRDMAILMVSEGANSDLRLSVAVGCTPSVTSRLCGRAAASSSSILASDLKIISTFCQIQSDAPLFHFIKGGFHQRVSLSGYALGKGLESSAESPEHSQRLQ